MSATCLVLVSRELGGELIACMGIEFQAPGVAPEPEICGYQCGPVDATTRCAKALLPLFGGVFPFGVSPMQKVTVFHQGLDFAEVLGPVPDHPCGLNCLCRHVFLPQKGC